EFPRSSDAGDVGPRSWKWLNPTPPTNELKAGFALNKDESWLVGSLGTVLHVKGSEVRVLQHGDDTVEYHSVWASSSEDVWVAGTSGRGGELLHWDGTSRFREFRTGGGPHIIDALWGTAKDDVWAVDPSSPAIWHWDGFRWNEEN